MGASPCKAISSTAVRCRNSGEHAHGIALPDLKPRYTGPIGNGGLNQGDVADRVQTHVV